MMRTGLATLAVVVAMLAFGVSDASAWVCRAGGVGVSTFGSSRNIERANANVAARCTSARSSIAADPADGQRWAELNGHREAIVALAAARS
jgi:hypothetical protein